MLIFVENKAYMYLHGKKKTFLELLTEIKHESIFYCEVFLFVITFYLQRDFYLAVNHNTTVFSCLPLGRFLYFPHVFFVASFRRFDTCAVVDLNNSRDMGFFFSEKGTTVFKILLFRSYANIELYDLNS